MGATRSEIEGGTRSVGLRRVTDDLWETTPDSPAPGLTTHAYLWTAAPAGNILFYSVGSDRDIDGLERLGGVAHQYLSHEDEAGPMLGELARHFGAALHAPAAEAAAIGRHRRPDVLLEGRGRDANLVDIVPTPGHTPGSTCFVVDGAAGRYLFTGDTVYRTAGGAWAAGYLPGFSDTGPLAQSLDVLADLQPDLVISSAFAGAAGVHAVDADQWQRCIAEARRSLEKAPS